LGTGRIRGAAALGLAAGTTTTAAIVAWYGIAQIGAAVVEGIVAVPATVVVHLSQLFLSALAWRLVVPGSAPRASLMFQARWVREAVNALLPVATIGGGIAGARLLARHAGLGAASAGASLTVDLTLEAVAQSLFLACGTATAWALSTGGRPLALAWVWTGLGSAIAAVIIFVAAQRLGLLKAVEAGMRRLFPSWLTGRRGEMHTAMVAIYGRRGASC
jgi:hypothetical protein